MTNEATHRKHAEDGHQASLVLENPVFKTVAEEISKEFAKAFKGDDDEVAMEARRKVQVFETLLGKLIKIREKGDRARKNLQEIEERKKVNEPIDINSMRGIA